MNIDKMITPLKFWCYKIIPLVYDDSLSYLECLCKIREKINEVIKNTNEIPEYIDQKIKESFDDEHIRELISEIFRTIEDAISANNEGTNTNFENDYEIGALLWHDNKLYRAKRHIDAGDTVIVGTNIELVNFADMFDEFITEIKTDFTDNDDGLRETSSTDRPMHDLVWLNNVLYEVIRPIAEGNAYIYSGANKNVEQINLDKIYDYLLDLISSEINAREEGDDTLQSNIDAEETARINADNDLQSNIDAEETARINANNGLQSNIDAEETARINADNGLQSNIDAEETARINADIALNTRIDNIRSSVFPTIYDFGGTGDGSDQTTAFQAAVNSGEEFILVPEGQYIVGSLNLSSLPASGGTVTFLVSPAANVTGAGADQLGIWSNNEFVIGIASNNTNRHRPLKIEHVTHSNAEDSVDAAVTVVDKVINANDSLFHWGILQITDDYSTNPANQNVGIYQQFNRYAVGESCWGIAIECRDRINGISDETGGVRGMEISLSGVGSAPSSGNRVGLHIICSDSDNQSQYQVNRGLYITAGGTRIGQATDQNGFKAGIEMTSGYFEKGIYFHDMLMGYGIDFGNATFIQAAIAIPHDTSIDFSNGFHVQYNSGIQALRFIQNSNDAYIKSNGLMHCAQMEVGTSGGNVITFTNEHSTGSHNTVNHWITVKIDGSNFYMPLYD